MLSKEQTEGIDFGRHMLLEHRMHCLKLQSEIELIIKEKAKVEEKVDSLLEEIALFEEVK